MRTIAHRLAILALLGAVLLGIAWAGSALPGRAWAGQRTVPVVVELFTSQGCNSCPPADAYLGELAKRPDVLALSLHVDYWDYIGWKDPFAQHAFTLRQREYSQALGQRYVYTPQMVINGRLQGVGSERGEIEKLIVSAAKDSAAASRPAISLTGDEVHVGEAQANGALSAVVWLAVYDAQSWTAVQRGENAGRRLGDTNVVRVWRELGRYTGKPASFKLDLDTASSGQSGYSGKPGYAVLIQRQTSSGLGPILAAAAIDPPPAK